MRNPAIVLIVGLAAVLMFSDIAVAQEVTDIAPGPGWLPAVRRHSLKAQAEDRKKYIDGHKNDPHNLTGVWGEAGIPLNMSTLPTYTPNGEQLAKETEAEVSPAGVPIEGSKDPQAKCDPMGFPRLFSFNWGFELIQLPNRTLQF